MRDGARVSHAFSSIDELGDGPGFRRVRTALGVTAFGVNAVVYPPRFHGFLHYHDVQDELYFVHRGRVTVEVDGETRELGEGGLFHAEAETPRRVSNPFDEEAVLYIVGGKGGYVERDGHMVDPADIPRRAAFGKSARSGN
jgi:quercetin dioxygenase-like cupin family protein